MNKQLYETIDIAIKTAMANLHTVTIAKVTSVVDKTISCQPVIQRVVDGKEITLPDFVEVPPIFMQGGSSYTAHPISVGDYCLLILTERCFDQWYSGQDFKPPLEFRMHDYSDGFALVGVNPFASALTIPAVITQIGDTYQNGNYVHDGDRTQTGNVTLTGDHTQTGDFTLTGNMVVNGNITCTGTMSALTATIGGIDFGTHTHGGIEPGAGSTGVPQ